MATRTICEWCNDEAATRVFHGLFLCSVCYQQAAAMFSPGAVKSSLKKVRPLFAWRSRVCPWLLSVWPLPVLLTVSLLLFGLVLPLGAFPAGSSAQVVLISQGPRAQPPFWVIQRGAATVTAGSSLPGSGGGFSVSVPFAASGGLAVTITAVSTMPSDDYTLIYLTAGQLYQSGFSITAPTGGTGTGGSTGTGTGGNTQPCSIDYSASENKLLSDGEPHPCDYLAAGHSFQAQTAPLLKILLVFLLALFGVWFGPGVVKRLIAAYLLHKWKNGGEEEYYAEEERLTAAHDAEKAAVTDEQRREYGWFKNEDGNWELGDRPPNPDDEAEPATLRSWDELRDQF